jgi:hypothetical protein
MKYRVRIKKEPLPKAELGTSTKGKLNNNAFQFPISFKEGMEPGLEVKKNLGPTSREKANIEAEKGETIITPMGDDAWTKALPKTYIIGGKKHSKGGTPLSVPEGSFIFSDYLKERDANILKMLGKAAKKSGYTYAELSKPYMLNDDIKLLLDPDSDQITKDTAQMNIQNKIDKLGLISLLQEASKGFTNDEGETDVPAVGIPYAEKVGLDIEKAIDPFLEAIKAPVQEQAYAQQMDNGMPPMQGMPATPMQQPEMQMPQGMPMRRGGLVKYKEGGAVKKYQKAGTIQSGERVRYNSQTGQYELVNANNELVGYVRPNEGSNRGIKISRGQIPADAIIIDRSKYNSQDEYETARAAAYTEANGKPVVVKNTDGSYKLVQQTSAWSDYESEDLNTLFAGQKNIAFQYNYIKEKFNNPKIKEELAKRARAAFDKPDNVRGMTPSEIAEIKKKLQDPNAAYEMFLDMQKRNLATYAHSTATGKPIADFENSPDELGSTNKQFDAEWKRIGLTTPTKLDAATQQALYIGYQNLLDDKSLSEDLKKELKGFKIEQVGKDDDVVKGKAGEGMISAIDGIYTNTTTGQVALLDDPKKFVEAGFEPDESLMTPEKQREALKYKPGNIRKGWTAPDIFEFARATRERFAPQPPVPFQAFPNYYLPNAFLLSPEDMQAQIRGQQALGLENIRAYAPSTAAMSASSQINADAITSQTAQIHNANQQIINNFTQNAANTINNFANNYANLTTNLYDKWSNRKEAIQARNSAALAEVSKAFGLGETNEAGYQAMNLRTPNFQWNPFTQDYEGFIPSGLINPSTDNQTTAFDIFSKYKRSMPGVSDNVVWNIAKADAGIQDNTPDIPDYLSYQAGIPG